MKITRSLVVVFFSSVLVFLPEVKTEQIAECQNYGTPLNSTDCKCPAYVEGRLCENVICRRFGVPDKNRCSCAPGWYDKYCGLRGCRPPNEDNLNLEKRSMIIVFNTKTTMKTQLDTLKTNFKEMVSRITKNSLQMTDNWIENFIIYGFAQSTSDLHIQSSILSDVDDVVNYLSNLTLYDGDSTQPVLTAMKNAQQLYPTMKSHSIVLVFTDSPSSDATEWSHRFTEKNAEQTVLQISLLWRSKYFFFLSLPSGTDFSSNGIDVYRRLSLTNHGVSLFIQDSNELSKSLLSIIGSQYFPENVAVGYGKTQNEQLITYVDNDGDSVYFLLTIDPSTQSALPSINDSNLTLEGKYYRFYTRPSKTGDTVTISSSSGTNYNYRMFIQSKNTLLFDYNDDMHIDVGNGMAVIGIGMSSTMQTYGFPQWQNSSYEVRSSNGTLLREKFYSYERPQHDCTFLYGFAVWDTLTCPPGPVTQLHTFYYNGFNQQRVSTGYCIQSDHNAQYPNGISFNDRKMNEEQTSEADSLQCNQKNIDSINDPRLHEPKQFIFILELHSDNRQIYSTLASEIHQILSLTNSTTQTVYRKEFTLIVHDSKESRVLLSSYNPIYFGNKFESLVNSLALLPNLDNTMGLLSIVQAQKMNIQPTAQVYYFTNQAVKNVQNVSRTWDLVKRDVEVNFFTIADGITTEIFALPKELELIQKMTNGRLIPLTKTETTLLPLFSDMMSVTTLTTDNEQYNCHDNSLEINGYFEDGAEFSVVQVIGTGLKSVRVQDSNGALVSVSDYITYKNPNFVSMRIASGLFSNGIWKLSALVTSGGCQITVRQKTSIGVILGFSSSNTDDNVSTQIISQRSLSGSQPIFVPIKVTDGITPNNLEIQIVNRKRYDQPRNYFNSTIVSRDSNSCSYNFVSDSIIVPKNELTTWTVSAFNSGKLTLHRIFYYYQHLPADPSVCHGGQVDQYGRCVCPERYTGDYCWDRICQPPATYSYGICSCPPGFYGDFCEIELVLTETTNATTVIPITPTTDSSKSISSISVIILVFMFLY
uniref:EGF-like domain-containing protein n=1 Tax=Caenorhabditis tropicalis TaxID=1561998 RepID=A0A1I7T9E6_9PELO